MTFVIKIVHDTEARRHTVPLDVTYDALLQLAKSSFPSLADGGFVTAYRDDEGDTITLSTTEELREAQRVGASKSGCLRIWCFEASALPVPISLSSFDGSSVTSDEFLLVGDDIVMEDEASALLADLEGGGGDGKSRGRQSSEAASEVSAGFGAADAAFVDLDSAKQLEALGAASAAGGTSSMESSAELAAPPVAAPVAIEAKGEEEEEEEESKVPDIPVVIPEVPDIPEMHVDAQADAEEKADALLDAAIASAVLEEEGRADPAVLQAEETRLQEAADLALAETLEREEAEIRDAIQQTEEAKASSAAAPAAVGNEAAQQAMASFAGDAVAQLLAGLVGGGGASSGGRGAAAAGAPPVDIGDLVKSALPILGALQSALPKAAPPAPAPESAPAPAPAEAPAVASPVESQTEPEGDEDAPQTNAQEAETQTQKESPDESPDEASADMDPLCTAVLRLLSSPKVVAALQVAVASAPAADAVVEAAAHTLRTGEPIGLRTLGVLMPLLPRLLPVLAQLLKDAPELATELGPALATAELCCLFGGRAGAGPVAPTEAAAPQVTAPSTLRAIVHRGVMCDGCEEHDDLRATSVAAGGSRGKYIAGVRFKSAVVEDFDLCAPCEGTGRYELTHAPFLKIRTPATAPATILCVLKEEEGGAHAAPPAAMDGGATGRRHGGGGCGGGGHWRGHQRNKQQGQQRPCSWRREHRQQWRQMHQACAELSKLGAGPAVACALGEVATKAAEAVAQASADSDLAKAINESVLTAATTAAMAATSASDATKKVFAAMPAQQSVVDAAAAAATTAATAAASASDATKKVFAALETPLAADCVSVKAHQPTRACATADVGRGFLFVNGTNGFVEYTVRVPKETAAVKVDATLFAGDSRPLTLRVDGAVVDTRFARQTTGSFANRAGAARFEQGTYAVPPPPPAAAAESGGGEEHRELVLRLSTLGFFPHLVSLGVTPLSLADAAVLEAAAVGAAAVGAAAAEGAEGALSGEQTTTDAKTMAVAAVAAAAAVAAPPVPPHFYGTHTRTMCDGCHAKDAALGAALLPVAVSNGNVGAGGTIRGLRYRSLKASDFDLCASCKGSGQFDAEPYAPYELVEPVRPLPAPQPQSEAPPKLPKPQQAPAPPPRKQPAKPAAVKPRTCSTAAEIKAAAAAAGGGSSSAGGGKKKEAQLVYFTRDHLVAEHDKAYAAHNIKAFPKGAVVALERGTLKCGLGGVYRDYVFVRGHFKAGRVSRKVLKPYTDKAPAGAKPAAPPKKAPQQQKQQAASSSRPMARFVRDVSISDGAVVAPGSRFRKAWRVLNSGKQAWPAGTRVVCVGGDQLGGPETGVLVPAQPAGETVDIEIELVAPHKPGRYVGYWRLVTPGATRFGHRFWVDLRVDAELPSAPPASPAAAAAPKPAATSGGKWALQLQLLEGMGFKDSAKATAALEAESGDLQRAVHCLLSSAGDRD